MGLAIAFAAVLGLLIAFQLALALGAPWGRLAWGGQHPGRLPAGYRIGSGLSVLVYAAIALLALDLGGVFDVVPDAVSQAGMWVVSGLLALGVVMNAISRSKPERSAMIPVALVLAVLAFLIALAGPVSRGFEGMVLDNGEGPVFCTIVMESYPPQCGGGSPRMSGWDWDTVEHEQEQSVRWGDYRFEGRLDGGTIRATSSASQL